MNTQNAAVWIDHQEAHVFHLGPHSFDEETVLPAHPHRRLHRKSGPGPDSGQRAKDDHKYYDGVANALSDSRGILVVGPAPTKLELIRHLRAHRREIAHRVVSVETVDHRTDRQIVAYARRYFDAHGEEISP